MIRSLLALKFRMENALRGREEGAMMIEYVLVAGIVSVGIVLAFLLAPWEGVFGALADAVVDAFGGVAIL